MKKRDGFTLVELLLALAILPVILFACYQFFTIVYGSFGRAEQLWIEQEDMFAAAEAIEKKVFTAAYIEITDEADGSGEDYNSIYQGEDNLIYFKSPGGVPLPLSSGKAALLFWCEDGTTLHFSITSFDRDGNEGYSVFSAVYMRNLNGTIAVSEEVGVTARNGIKFK